MTRNKLKRDLWRMADGTWGAEVMRHPDGVGIGVRGVSLRAALWHLLTCRRPEEYATVYRRDARRF